MDYSLQIEFLIGQFYEFYELELFSFNFSSLYECVAGIPDLRIQNHEYTSYEYTSYEYTSV